MALRALVLATLNVLAAGIYAHAKEIADNLLGEDPNDIDKIYTKLLWAGASVGRSGMAVQAISLSISPYGI